MTIARPPRCRVSRPSPPRRAWMVSRARRECSILKCDAEVGCGWFGYRVVFRASFREYSTQYVVWSIRAGRFEFFPRATWKLSVERRAFFLPITMFLFFAWMVSRPRSVFFEDSSCYRACFLSKLPKYSRSIGARTPPPDARSAGSFNRIDQTESVPRCSR